MSKEKLSCMIEVAFDLIAKVHSELCRTVSKDDDIKDDASDILRKIFLLDEKLKGGMKNNASN